MPVGDTVNRDGSPSRRLPYKNINRLHPGARQGPAYDRANAGLARHIDSEVGLRADFNRKGIRSVP